MQSKFILQSSLVIITLMGLGFLELVFAQDPTQLEEITVTAVKRKEKLTSLPAVQGTHIYSGKKSQIIDLEDKPTIINNNYRQVWNKTPGILWSEETTPLVSFGYRGLNPDRAQFTQVLKDGVPITADMFGYPEAYYTPPIQAVERIELIHGGGSLLYGPQPGGALNYITKDPVREKPFSFYTENSFGSDSFYSNYTSLSGALNSFGYLGYFHHRQTNGFRDNNSDVDLVGGSLKLSLQSDEKTKWIFTYDGYEEEHGEPGGLTRANFDADPDQTTRLYDRFQLDRQYGVLTYQREISPETLLETKTFGGYYKRFSMRQRGGGFGTLPTGANASANDIQTQEFNTLGFEPRLRHTYDAFGYSDHALAAGMLFYYDDSPRIDERGSSPDTETGTVRFDADRTLKYLSFFAENRFQLDRFSITPGIRLEHIWQEVVENINSDKKDAGTPLGSADEFDFVPLLGLGMTYQLRPQMELYSNISQSYRPKIFAQAVPTDGTRVVNSDLEEGKSWQAELGLRSSPTSYWNWEASFFWLDFDNQIGNDANTVSNIGHSVHRGIEFINELDLAEWYDWRRQTHWVERIGSLNLYTTGTILDAEFIEGPADGNEPQYAPSYLFKGGLDYQLGDSLKVNLGSTFVAKHYADDTHTPNRFIPSYKVWDLTAEWYAKSAFKIVAGINNLFDEHYYARVTGTGIDPAARRNYYGGATVKF